MNVTKLNLQCNEQLQNVDSLEKLTNLKILNLKCCTAIQNINININGIEKFSNLINLDLQIFTMDGKQGCNGT